MVTTAPVAPDSVIEQLQKVLALTNSPIAGEAEAAMLMATKLMEKYNLSLEEVKGKDFSKSTVTHEQYVASNKKEPWKSTLLAIIARYNYGTVLNYPKDRRTLTAIIAEPHNILAIKYMYEYLVKAVTKLYKAEVKEHFYPGEKGWAKWARDYGEGFNRGLADRLRKMRETATAEVTAMVLVKSTDVDNYTKNKFNPKETKERSRDLSYAASYGYQDAQSIAINQGLNAPAAGGPSLPSSKSTAVAKKKVA